MKAFPSMNDIAIGTTRRMNCSSTPRDAVQCDGSEIEFLLRYSARIGRDPLLTQASSGNTSLKINGTLWIKASGKWLADAGQEDVVVPVSLSECLECFKQGRPLTMCNTSSRGERLRPSIETFMHAVLPHRSVIHVHCVNTLAWAVRADARTRLSERLSDMRWTWIPYVPSGLPLAREIQRASANCPETDVFILGNHGLVACGESCEAADSVMRQVQQRLAVHARAPAKPKLKDLKRIRALSSWRLPDCDDALHALGTDGISRQIVGGGILYPCQAIFLGQDTSPLRAPEYLFDLRSGTDPVDLRRPFLIVEGCGILVSSEMTAAELAVLRGLTQVVLRVEPTAPIRYLSRCEVASLLRTEDSHLYRVSAENGLHAN